MQFPFRQNWPAGQAFPQNPQFLLSVRTSTQTLSHLSRSDGQTTGFVVGTGVGFVVAVAIVVTGSSVVGMGVGSSVMTSAQELVVGSTTGDAAAESPMEERIPAPVSMGKTIKTNPRMTMARTATAIRPVARLMAGARPAGAGVSVTGRSGVKDAPQAVQNFLFKSTALPHFGQNCNGRSPERSILVPFVAWEKKVLMNILQEKKSVFGYIPAGERLVEDLLVGLFCQQAHNDHCDDRDDECVR